jgi:hypothetical protein
MDRVGPKRPKKGCTQRTSKELNPSKDLQKNGPKGLRKEWTQRTTTKLQPIKDLGGSGPKGQKKLYILAHIKPIKEWLISIGAISGLLISGCKGLKGS